MRTHLTDSPFHGLIQHVFPCRPRIMACIASLLVTLRTCPMKQWGGLYADEGVSASPRWQHQGVHPTPFATEQFDAEAGTDSPRLEPQGSTAAALEAAVMEHASTNRRESSAEWGQAGLPDSNGSVDHAAAGAGSTFIYPCDELDCSDEEAARVGPQSLFNDIFHHLSFEHEHSFSGACCGLSKAA